MLAATEFIADHPETGIQYEWAFIGTIFLDGKKYAKCQASKVVLPDGELSVHHDCTDSFACPMVWHPESGNYWDWLLTEHFQDKILIKESDNG